MGLEVVDFDARWRPAAAALWTARLGSARVVSRGRLHDPSMLPGLVALSDSEFAGIVTYHRGPEAWEVVTVHSAIEGAGAATALLDALAERARAAGCRRLWLITTNDNTLALRFYQRRGWRLSAFYPGAVEESRRRLKPEIPAAGDAGIPIRDELELELRLDRSP